MQEVYIRLCRDSAFTIDPVVCAHVAARMLDRHPIDIWLALDWDNMVTIANGSHPVVRL